MTVMEGFAGAPYAARKGVAWREFQTTLLGMMGHDFRQSLQIMQSTYALLRSRPEALPEEALLNRGESAVSKLADRLDCMVHAFYLSECADGVDVTRFALAPLFGRARQQNEDAAIQKGIALRVRGTDAYVVSNPLLLSSILRNLLTNAIQYTEPGGRVVIGCRRRGAQARIDVCDTGIGIRADQMQRISGGFARLGADRCDGFGIGLSMVRHAVDLLGHRIEVRSVPGEGSRFSIFLPVAVLENKS
jgi:two-component system, OmpR family, phosphate regulon sensor histidine kinase PhoR